MVRNGHFLITDCYTKESRAKFDEHGVVYAGKLYAALTKKFLPDSKCDIFYTSDEGVMVPQLPELEEYDAVIWPGCNLTVYHTDDPRVTRLVDLSKSAYELGLPQFGSCWAAQMAVYAAGGMVGPNPKGREMGIARKIYITEEGKTHPLMEGKPPVFDGFVSHDDMITKMPEGGTILASNDFTPVQALEVKHKKGVFWATQYHPEYTLEVVANLISAREEKLRHQGYFNSHTDMVHYTTDLKKIYKNPARKDLRWKYDIGDDVIVDAIRQKEFENWINKQVIPVLGH